MSIYSFANDAITKSVRIVPNIKKISKEGTFYFVQTPKGKKIAQFQFKNNGEISDLNLKSHYRRKKEGICSLFAIKKFVTLKAKKENFDYVTFYAKENNPNNVARLYKKFAELVDDSVMLFMMPVTRYGKNKIQELKKMQNFIFFESIF